MVDGPAGSPTRLAQNAGLVVVQASQRVMRDPEDKDMATKQPRKPAKSAAKGDAGAANPSVHHHQRAPRPRTPPARSKPPATQTSQQPGRRLRLPRAAPIGSDCRQ